MIDLVLGDNLRFCWNTKNRYDFIYGDCMYESTDFRWLDACTHILKPGGILIIQTDYHTVAEYKTRMTFYEKTRGFTFINWLIYMNNWGGTPHNRFAQKHDDILVYCNGSSWKWRPDRVQIPKATAGTSLDKKGTGMKTPPSVFYDKASFSTMSRERVRVGDSSFSMQKPEWLMERLLLPFTDEGDDVLDLFMGTGTLGVVSKRSRRNYTGVEQDFVVYNKAVNRINNGDL